MARNEKECNEYFQEKVFKFRFLAEIRSNGWQIE